MVLFRILSLKRVCKFERPDFFRISASEIVYKFGKKSLNSDSFYFSEFYQLLRACNSEKKQASEFIYPCRLQNSKKTVSIKYPDPSMWSPEPLIRKIHSVIWKVCSGTPNLKNSHRNMGSLFKLKLPIPTRNNSVLPMESLSYQKNDGGRRMPPT